MRKLTIFVLVGLMLIGGLSVGIYAQSSDSSNGDDLEGESDVEASVTADAEIGVNTIAAIRIEHDTVDLGELDSSMYDVEDNEWDNLTAEGFDVEAYANTNYTVDVKADEAPDGLSGELQIDVGQGDSWSNLFSDGSTSSVDVWDDASSGHRSKTVDYRYVPDNDDSPGDYSTTLTYTISTS